MPGVGHVGVDEGAAGQGQQASPSTPEAGGDAGDDVGNEAAAGAPRALSLPTSRGRTGRTRRSLPAPARQQGAQGGVAGRQVVELAGGDEPPSAPLFTLPSACRRR